jgi:hypothetical protein
MLYVNEKTLALDSSIANDNLLMSSEFLVTVV